MGGLPLVTQTHACRRRAWPFLFNIGLATVFSTSRFAAALYCCINRVSLFACSDVAGLNWRNAVSRHCGRGAANVAERRRAPFFMQVGSSSAWRFTRGVLFRRASGAATR